MTRAAAKTMKLVPAFLALALTLAQGPLARAAPGQGGGTETATATATTVRESIERAKEIERAIVAVADRTAPAFLVVSGGSGVLISADGYALTNHHVVATREVGERWWVRRARGGRLLARLVAIDPRGDIALLKVESEEPLPFLELGDSDTVTIGDLAIALGNPYGFGTRDAEPTVSLGIVGAVHTYRQGYNDAIQTDAAINPGNSGGPLVNLRGEVIGINGRVAVRFGNRMNTGVGYAIPANQIKQFLPRLKEGGTVRHGVIPGLTLVETDEGDGGARVASVGSGTLAERLGFERDDVIVRVDGREIPSPNAFLSAIGCFPAESTVTVIARRGEGERSIRASLAPLLPHPQARGGAYLGIRIGTARDDDEGEEGVDIADVIKGSPAAAAGLRKGDILLRLNGTPVRSQRDLERLLAELRPGATAELELRRGPDSFGVEVELGRAP